MNKYIDPIIYNHINTLDKSELLKMQKQLSNEVRKGLLIGIKYNKELELINARLGDQ